MKAKVQKMAPVKKVVFGDGKQTEAKKVSKVEVADEAPLQASKALTPKERRNTERFQEVNVNSKEGRAATLKSLGVGEGAAEATEKKGRIWLKWTENRIWIVFPQKGSNFLSTLTKADAVLTRDQVKSALKSERQMNILPGLHDYSEGLWDRVKEHEDVEMALNDGRLILVLQSDVGVTGPMADAPMRKMPDTLDEVSTPMAREMAEGCQDEVVLKRWLESERQGKGRGTVLTELEGQLALVVETEDVVQEANGR